MKRMFMLVLIFIMLLNIVVGNTEMVNAKENAANELPILEVYPAPQSDGVRVDASVNVDLDPSHKNFKRYKDFIEKGKYKAFLNGSEVDSYFDSELNSLIFYGFSLDVNTEYTVALKFLADANNEKNNSDMVSEVYSFKTSAEGLPTVRHMDDDGNLYTFSSGQESIIENLTLENERHLEVDKLLDPKEKDSLLSSPVSVKFLEGAEEAKDEVKVSVKFKENPYGIVNLHIDEDRAEWIPFFTETSDDEVKFELKEDVLLVPFVKNEANAAPNLLSSLSELVTGYTVSAADYTVNKMFNITENSNGRFQATLSYLLDNPSTFEFFGDPKYYYQLFKGTDDKGILVHQKDILDSLTINENLDTAVYEIRIFEDDPGFLDDHFWSQEIFSERTPVLLNDSQVHELAEKYAPILTYHEEEQFFPISIEELMNANVPNDVTVKTPSIFSANNTIPYDKLEEFLSFNGHSSYLINGGDGVGLNQVTGSRENATIYYSYIERENRKFINYHFLYAYDPKTINENEELARHNFDRESITIELSTTNEIKDLVVSGHLAGQRMNLVGDDFYWESSRLKIPASEEFPEYEDRPIIPVALGAHALFPVSGRYTINVPWVPSMLDAEDQTGLLKDLTDSDFNERPIDNTSGRNIILPDSENMASDDFNHYSLKELTLAQTSTSNHSALSFSGDWVDVPSIDNAAFPPFTEKEKSVVAWVDGADTDWNMSRFEEGSAPRESINDINEYLIRYMRTDAGQISGLIKNAITDEAIENALIQGFTSDRAPMRNKAKSDDDGLYTIDMPAGDGFNLVISKPGYIPLEYQSLSLERDEEKFLETLLQIPSEFENLQNGVFKGTIIQADTGGTVTNAKLTLRKNFNAKEGEAIEVATSNSRGEYLFENLTTGYYTVEVEREGYSTNYVNVVVVGGREVVRQITLSPKLNENEMRIVLEWGASPRDLDSHLIGESASGRQFHVSYSNKGYYEDGRLHAELDLDDVSSYGPETVTIHGIKISDNENGTYQYYVHDYTNRFNSASDALSKSDAKVKVYTSSGYSEYTVPQNQTGTKWTVFKIVNGILAPINTLE